MRTMWLKDPVSRQPSVALTLLVLATVLMVVFTVLEAFAVLTSTHLLDEFWGSCIALYGGHIYAFKDTKEMPTKQDITPGP